MAIKLLLTCFAVLMLANVSAFNGIPHYKKDNQCPDKETNWMSEEDYDSSNFWSSKLGWLPNGCLAKGFKCRDSYCDDVKLVGGCCLGKMDINWYWTKPFSEEQKAPTLCKRDHFVAGIRCEGSYCDNISLFCIMLMDLDNKRGTESKWGDCNSSPSAWISEEGNGTYMVQQHGYYIIGVECSGAYCDNKRFYTCPLESIYPKSFGFGFNFT